MDLFAGLNKRLEIEGVSPKELFEMFCKVTLQTEKISMKLCQKDLILIEDRHDKKNLIMLRCAKNYFQLREIPKIIPTTECNYIKTHILKEMEEKLPEHAALVNEIPVFCKDCWKRFLLLYNNGIIKRTTE